MTVIYQNTRLAHVYTIGSAFNRVEPLGSVRSLPVTKNNDRGTRSGATDVGQINPLVNVGSLVEFEDVVLGVAGRMDVDGLRV